MKIKSSNKIWGAVLLSVFLYLTLNTYVVGTDFKYLSISRAISVSSQLLEVIDRYQNPGNSRQINRKQFERALRSIVDPSRIELFLKAWDKAVSTELEGLSLQEYESFRHGDDPTSITTTFGEKSPDGATARLQIEYELYGVEKVGDSYIDQYKTVSVYLDAFKDEALFRDFFRWKVVDMKIE